MNQLLMGFVLAVAVAFAAYSVQSLNFSGFLAAIFVGSVVFGLGGWQWAVLLMLFFISSSLLTKAFTKRKVSLNEKFSKGGRRDWAQVFGNGGMATLFVLLHSLPIFTGDTFFWYAFVATLAAVNADTWATEVGVLNPVPPRSITNWNQMVEKGTSGGVSLYGSVGSLLGAAVVALAGVLLSPFPDSFSPSVFITLTLAGFFGSLFDSFLGATVQAIYYCPICQKDTERHPLHTCGTKTSLLRGWPWLNNDLVNFACSTFAVLFVFLI